MSQFRSHGPPQLLVTSSDSTQLLLSLVFSPPLRVLAALSGYFLITNAYQARRCIGGARFHASLFGSRHYLAPRICYMSLESIGFTRDILTFPLCVFLSFSTAMLTVTLSNTAISTSSPFTPEEGIVKVYLSASNLVSRLNVTRPSMPSL